jgi:hypothetical protein
MDLAGRKLDRIAAGYERCVDDNRCRGFSPLKVNRHCERSEAIQLWLSKLDLLRRKRSSQ